MTEESREALRTRAMERARALYSWDAVTTSYETLLERIVTPG